MARGPRTVYFSITGASALAFSIFFAVAPLYRLQVAGLDPLQLVLVGSVMEGMVFICEVPTGIVADAVSRRLSVIVGHAGMGAAFLLEAAQPTFAGVLIAQALWGLAYTFTSGATTAWVSDELDDDSSATLTPLFLRASRVSSMATLVGLPLTWALAGLSLRLPLVIGGVIELALAAWLVVAMAERHHPTRQAGDTLRERCAATARAGTRAITASRVLVLCAVAILVAGGASEAFDRLWEAHLLVDVGFPGSWSPLVWFGVITTLSAAVGIVLPGLVERAAPAATRSQLMHWLVGLTALQVVGLFAFGLASSLFVAASALLVVNQTRRLRASLMASWLVPLTPRAQRATALSALEQCDSLGQVLIGPGFGLLARTAGISAAIVASGAVMAPATGVLLAAGRADERTTSVSAPYASGA